MRTCVVVALVVSAGAFAPAAPILRSSRATTVVFSTGENDAAPTGDLFVSAISADGKVSAKAIDTTVLVAEAARRQGATALASAALGRAMTCCLLMADGLKQEEKFQVSLQGNGPLGGVLATANGALECRGCVGAPETVLPLSPKGKLDVGAGVGKGNLHVVRTKMLPGETSTSNYASVTEIQTGEIAEDINFFLAKSEQREGALAAGVHVQPQNAQDLKPPVDAAGGWSIALLPGADDATAAALMANIEGLPSPTQLIRAGVGPEEVVNKLLAGMEPRVLSERTPAFVCGCSDATLYRTVRMLPKSEIDELLAEQGQLEAGCEFCGQTYRLSADEVRAELAKSSS